MSIKVENLTKIYGNQKAIDQISFEVNKGEIVGFLGPNGAGKSTTMKIITGYLPCNYGNAYINDIDVKINPLLVKEQIGYLPEHNPLYLDMYVKEFLKFMGEISGMKGKILEKRIEEIIELVGIGNEKTKKISQLSKGYRQRVGLAQTLLPNPSVLILDEPTTGLDPNQLTEIRQVIKEAGKNKTVLLSTHIMQEVEALCDRVVIINKGKIVANTTLVELKSIGKTVEKLFQEVTI